MHYDSGSIVNKISSHHSVKNCKSALNLYKINTPVYEMLCISDDERIYLLEFADRYRLQQKILSTCIQAEKNLQYGCTYPIKSIQDELNSYFNGTLKTFQTPYFMVGSEFQMLVWNELKSIQYGKTINYITQAKAICRESSCRAVANANSDNPLSIIVPCHRVIRSNGELGGYGGGIVRKTFLLQHESFNINNL